MGKKQGAGGGLIALLLVAVMVGAGFLVYRGMGQESTGPVTVASLGLKPPSDAVSQPGAAATPDSGSAPSAPGPSGDAVPDQGGAAVGGGGLVVGGATTPDGTGPDEGTEVGTGEDQPATVDPGGTMAPAPDPATVAPVESFEPAPSTGSLVGKPVTSKGTSGTTGTGATGAPVGYGDQVLTPGVWHAQPGCMYSLNGVSSAYIVGGTAQVEIKGGDKFWSTCSWNPGYAPGGGGRATFGTHVVGRDMAPGTWVADSTECVYSFRPDLRLSASRDYGYTTREKSDFILKAGDVFESNQECGGWTKVG